LSTEQLTAIALILLLTWTNTRGLEIGTFVQNTFTLAKTAALLALIVIGLSMGWKADSAALSSDWWDSWRNGWSPLAAQPGLTVAGGFALALLFGEARVRPVLARDRLFFRRSSTINARSVPAAALFAQGIWAAFLTLPRTVTTNPATGEVSYGNVYTQLLEYIVSADLVFYVLLAVAVIVLRKRQPEADRPYRTWGYPVVPIVSVVL